MYISEEEKKRILSKYDGETSEEVLNHLKRTYDVYTTSLDWMPEPIKSLSVNGKMYHLKDNKKFLKEKIFNIIKDDFPNVDLKILRRTVKKFLDGITL